MNYVAPTIIDNVKALTSIQGTEKGMSPAETDSEPTVISAYEADE
jgi:hypothetical protein